MNKIFFKIGILFSVTIVVYLMFVIYLISPKMTEYLTKVEIKHAKTQLDRISNIINDRENYLKEYKKQRTIVHQEEINEHLKIAYNIFQKFNKIYTEGGISKEEALESSFDLISKLRHKSHDEYIYVLDSTGLVHFHPDKKLVNKNMYNTKDIKGKSFVKEIIKNALGNKNSYIDYFWKELNSEKISKKTVISIYFKPLDLIICSGVYIDDIKDEIKAKKDEIIQELEKLISDMSESQMGYVFAINKDEKIALHPEIKLLGKDLTSIYKSIKNTNIYNSLKESYKNKNSWEYLKIGEDKYRNNDNKKIAWVKFNKYFNWYIVSSLNKEDLQNNAKEVNNMVINISLIILVILSIIAIFLIKKLLYPLTTLSKNVNLVKEGNFDIRNDFKSNDEIGILAEHFDSMMDYIEENTKNLEITVAKRTKELEHRLYHDELTKLRNRLCLEKDIVGLEFCALSLIDIKGFNDINELYGFKIGDQILLEVTRVLKEFCKENDLLLYKLNADIFAILDKSMKFVVNYQNVLENIEHLFAKNIYVQELESNINLQITIGVSIAQDEPIKTANMALKKAKKTDLKYLVYSTDIDTKENIEKSMYWQIKIKDAIENDKIVPFFQPIFNKNKEIVKYETLMRLYDESLENKYISPGNFLGIAAKTGQYFKLNQIVIKKAFDKINIINNSVSVNIGFNEIWSLDFTEFIDEQMEKLSEEQRGKIVFEILESDFITDYKVFEDFISKYRKKGIKIAIDDFGTGYSNFEHILKIKPDYIKIDGSLIKDIHKDENSYQMVKSIVAFSKSLGIKNIAEFVHNEEVYNVTKSLDIDEYQGFYLGEPKPLV